MPEAYFTARRPDGLAQRCYSLSPEATDHSPPGLSYLLRSLVARSRREAVKTGSERVRTKTAPAVGVPWSGPWRSGRGRPRFDGDAKADVRAEEFDK